jgi:hypothetical protein
MNEPDVVPAAGDMIAPAHATRDQIAGVPSASQPFAEPAKNGN